MSLELENNLCIVLVHAEHIVGAPFCTDDQSRKLVQERSPSLLVAFVSSSPADVCLDCPTFLPHGVIDPMANCGGFRRTSVPTSVTNAFMADSMTALQKPDGGVRGSAALSRDRLPKRWFVDSAQGGCSLRAIPVRILCQSRLRLRRKCHQGTDGRTLTLQPQYSLMLRFWGAERHCRRCCATSQV